MSLWFSFLSFLGPIPVAFQRGPEGLAAQSTPGRPHQTLWQPQKWHLRHQECKVVRQYRLDRNLPEEGWQYFEVFFTSCLIRFCLYQNSEFEHHIWPLYPRPPFDLNPSLSYHFSPTCLDMDKIALPCSVISYRFLGLQSSILQNWSTS